VRVASSSRTGSSSAPVPCASPALPSPPRAASRSCSSGEIADQVAPELGKPRVAGISRAGSTTKRSGSTAPERASCQARGGQKAVGGTSRASKLAPSTGSVWSSSISGSTSRQRSADPSRPPRSRGRSASRQRSTWRSRPGPGWDPLVPGHGDEQHSEIPAAYRVSISLIRSGSMPFAA